MSEASSGEGRIGVHLTDLQRRAWLRLIRSENVGPSTFRSLVNHFGSASAALDALPELARRGGARARIRVASEDDIAREWAAAESNGARFVALGEPGYPRYLRSIEGPPPILAIRGGQSPLLGVGARPPGFFDASYGDRPTVAVVGSRNASISGRKFAALLARDAGEAGYLVISGLARGIDAAAHQAALATGTTAVLAGGLDRIYPPEHVPLADAIVAEGGALVSEMPFGWEPRARDFPRRNRLISGIALGVVVVEAAAKSGSLHTARFAAEQGREVFAVPGSPLDPRAEGCNDLIRSGATLISRPEHLLESLAPLCGQDPPLSGADEPFHPPEAPIMPAATDLERARQTIFTALGATPTAIDDLLRMTDVAPAAVQMVLLELELAGRLERHGQGRVSLIL